MKKTQKKINNLFVNAFIYYDKRLQRKKNITIIFCNSNNVFFKYIILFTQVVFLFIVYKLCQKKTKNELFNNNFFV